jgi:hypothetical protein
MDAGDSVAIAVHHECPVIQLISIMYVCMYVCICCLLCFFVLTEMCVTVLLLWGPFKTAFRLR